MDKWFFWIPQRRARPGGSTILNIPVSTFFQAMKLLYLWEGSFSNCWRKSHKSRPSKQEERKPEVKWGQSLLILSMIGRIYKIDSLLLYSPPSLDPLLLLLLFLVAPCERAEDDLLLLEGLIWPEVVVTPFDPPPSRSLLVEFEVGPE